MVRICAVQAHRERGLRGQTSVDEPSSTGPLVTKITACCSESSLMDLNLYQHCPGEPGWGRMLPPAAAERSRREPSPGWPKACWKAPRGVQWGCPCGRAETAPALSNPAKCQPDQQAGEAHPEPSIGTAAEACKAHFSSRGELHPDRRGRTGLNSITMRERSYSW